MARLIFDNIVDAHPLFFGTARNGKEGYLSLDGLTDIQIYEGGFPVLMSSLPTYWSNRVFAFWLLLFSQQILFTMPSDGALLSVWGSRFS